MVNKEQKLLAHHEQIKTIIGIYIALFITVPILALCFSYLVYSSKIDAGVQGAVKLALLSGLKWYAIIISIITVLFTIWFLFYADKVKFTDSSIEYYRWIFSKKTRKIVYEDITECVLAGRLWNNERKRTRSRKIVLFNKAKIIITFDINFKLSLMLLLKLGEQKFKLVSEKGNLSSISKYFDIDFMSLTYDAQLKILQYYCSFTKYKYKSGAEILDNNKHK